MPRVESPVPRDECARILQAYGVRRGHFTRQEWYNSGGDLDSLPSEYVPCFQ